MGTMLNIVGKHSFKEEVTPQKLILLAVRLTKAIEAQYDEKLDETEIYFKGDFERPEIDIYIPNLGNGGILRLYKKTFTFTSYYKFHEFVYHTKAGTYGAGYFAEFRKEIYQLLNILGCREVMYLCDDGRILHEYLNLIEESYSYDEVYSRMEKRLGNPITKPNAIEVPHNRFSFYERLNEFVVDRFEDFED